MSIDRILNAIKGLQDLVEDEKENLNNGEYLRLCNATQRVYNCANAIKTGGVPSEADDDEEDPEAAKSMTPSTPLIKRRLLMSIFLFLFFKHLFKFFQSL